MAPFAGWEMPLQFAGVVEEHTAVRQRAGVFDVSHMQIVDLHGGTIEIASKKGSGTKVTILLPLKRA